MFVSVVMVAPPSAVSGTNIGILVFSARHRTPQVEELPVLLALVLGRAVQVLADDLAP